MQERGELLAQRLVALVVMAGHDRLLEDGLLDLPGQAAPRADYRLTERQGKPIFIETPSVGAHRSTSPAATRKIGGGSTLGPILPTCGLQAPHTVSQFPPPSPR